MPEYRIEQVKAHYSKSNLRKLLIILLIIVVFSAGMATLFKADDFNGNFHEMYTYIFGDGKTYQGFFPPKANSTDLMNYTLAIIDTLLMGMMSLLISVPVGICLSIFMSRNLLPFIFPGENYLAITLRKTTYIIAKTFANFFRSVNDLVWALIFVSALGLGPLAGVLALGIHSSGVMAKLLSERYEDIQIETVKASRFLGHGFVSLFFYSVIPQIAPHVISTILYRFETDTRSASILGAVGAGGIGFYLFEGLRNFENQKVTIIILMIIFMVAIIDYFSAFIRKKYLNL